MAKWLYPLILTISPLCFSATETINIDRVISNSTELAFPNEKNVQPEVSDLSVVNSIIMSNEEGERWAVVTVANLSSGARTLTHKHLMALTADGQRVTPNELSSHFNSNETISLTVAFGELKFPILRVYSRN